MENDITFSWTSANILTIVASVTTTVAAVTAFIYQVMNIRDRLRKPEFIFQMIGNGCLFRHYDFKSHYGCGIMRFNSLVSVKHKSATIVDMRACMYLDDADLHGISDCGDDFPPRVVFYRIKDDGMPAIFEDRDRGDISIELSPEGGLVKITGSFSVDGNFAAEYGEDLFSGRLSKPAHGLFIRFYVSFCYQYNGELYWSDEFPISVSPFGNCVAKKDGSCYVNAQGEPVQLETRTLNSPVYVEAME